MLPVERSVLESDNMNFGPVPSWFEFDHTLYYKIPKYIINDNEIQHEIKRLDRAFADAVISIQGEPGPSTGNSNTRTYNEPDYEYMVLTDRVFKANIKEIIRNEKCNAEHAVVKELMELLAVLQRVHTRTTQKKTVYIRNAASRIIRSLKKVMLPCQ